jgi:hypothetical protein
MLRIFSLLCVLAVFGGAGLALIGWPGARAAVISRDDRLMRAYEQVQAGMPFARLAILGFDTSKAERISKLAMMERFMPRDRAVFDALDPAVKRCYLGEKECTAYIFEIGGEQAVLLVQGGQVTWKMMTSSLVA